MFQWRMVSTILLLLLFLTVLSCTNQKKLDEALFKAPWNGGTEEIKKLIAKGASINAKDDRGWTVLMSVVNSAALYKNRVYENSNDTTQTLVANMIAMGADVNAKDNEGGTALMQAAISGEPALAQLLISKGAEVNARDNKGGTALMEAAGHPYNTALVQLLISKGADVNTKDNNGRTALMAAAERLGGGPAIVQLLISKGADVNARDNKGQTALKMAMESIEGDHRVLNDPLLQNNNEIITKHRKSLITHTKIANLLKEAGARQ